MAAANISEKKLLEMVKEGKTILAEYWAPWCGYCRKIHGAYEEIAEQYSGKIEVVKINMDDETQLWENGQIELIPTLVLYRNGEKAGSIVAPESKAAIETFIAGEIPQISHEEKKQVYDMLIIGGGPAGYTAALYAARAGMDALVLEKLSAGGQMALTHQI